MADQKMRNRQSFSATMIKRRIHSSHRTASVPPTPGAHTVQRWRVWTAILTAVTFVVLVSTAAMHHHTTAAEDQDCSICSVVTHKLADHPLVDLPKLTVIFISYAPFLPAMPGVAHVSPLLPPPSCGPPAPSLSVC
jgi:hypothetical protein